MENNAEYVRGFENALGICKAEKDELQFRLSLVQGVAEELTATLKEVRAERTGLHEKIQTLLGEASRLINGYSQVLDENRNMLWTLIGCETIARLRTPQNFPDVPESAALIAVNRLARDYDDAKNKTAAVRALIDNAFQPDAEHEAGWYLVRIKEVLGAN